MQEKEKNFFCNFDKSRFSLKRLNVFALFSFFPSTLYFSFISVFHSFVALVLFLNTILVACWWRHSKQSDWMLLSNVTRFGKCFNRLWQFVAGLFCIWLNFEATFDNVLFYSQISKSNPVNWPNCFCMTRQRSRIYVSSHRLGQ